MNVLIVGKNSQIGNRIQSWFESHQDDIKYDISQLDTIGDGWKSYDFSGIDVVIHVAAILKETKETTWELFHKVNTLLPFEIAKRAKAQGIKHFVFFSSMAVYGGGKELVKERITKDTKSAPTSKYGKSKYMAEELLHGLESPDFLLSIVRPPNVYVSGSDSGYIKRFARLLKYLPAIPDVYQDVVQSMLYVDNLVELTRLIVNNRAGGLFTPQDDHAVSTSEIFQIISDVQGLNLKKSKFLGLIVRIMSFIPFVEKVYGGVAYDDELAHCQGLKYQIVSARDGLTNTIKSYL